MIAMDAKEVWKSAENALIKGDVSTLEQLLRENEQLFGEQRPPSYGSGGLAPDYSDGDARSMVVRNNHFESWDRSSEYIEALNNTNSPFPPSHTALDPTL